MSNKSKIDPIITVKQLCKSYPLYTKKQDHLLELFDPFRKQRHTLFHALNSISFSIYKNESIGIMGINGSGKSTLLKLLTGVLTPSSGEISVKGKVSALLELGAGFHPERTGLENIYFQGALHGQTKQEIDSYLAEIIQFADIGEYIHQPVKLYSSGMFIRLAFATAIQGNPDILIIDEALAVGDVCFQRLCFQRIEELKQQGVTFIFVSHSSDQIVAHCSRALLLGNGQLIMDGEPRNVVNRYMDILFNRNDKLSNTIKANVTLPESISTVTEKPTELTTNYDLKDKEKLNDPYSLHPWYNPYEYRWGDGRATISDIHITSSGNINNVQPGDYLSIQLKTVFHTSIIRPIFGCTIKTHDGIIVYGSNTELTGSEILYDHVSAGSITFVTFTMHCNLAPGDYFFSFGVAVMEKDTVPLDRRYDSLLLTVHGPANFFGLSNLNMIIRNSGIKHV